MPRRGKYSGRISCTANHFTPDHRSRSDKGKTGFDSHHPAAGRSNAGVMERRLNIDLPTAISLSFFEATPPQNSARPGRWDQNGICSMVIPVDSLPQSEDNEGNYQVLFFATLSFFTINVTCPSRCAGTAPSSGRIHHATVPLFAGGWWPSPPATLIGRVFPRAKSQSTAPMSSSLPAQPCLTRAQPAMHWCRWHWLRLEQSIIRL